MKIKYLGDHEREFIPATGARPFVATPGDVVEVDEETGASLLDQPVWFEQVVETPPVTRSVSKQTKEIG